MSGRGVLAQACALGAGRPDARPCPGRDHDVTPCKSSCSVGSHMRSLQTRCEAARGRLKRLAGSMGCEHRDRREQQR